MQAAPAQAVKRFFRRSLDALQNARHVLAAAAPRSDGVEKCELMAEVERRHSWTSSRPAPDLARGSRSSVRLWRRLPSAQAGRGGGQPPLLHNALYCALAFGFIPGAYTMCRSRQLK
jgi:hypothetical protein